MPDIGKSGFDILPLMEGRVAHDNHTSADSKPLGALVLIRVRIILDVLRQHLHVDPGGRLVTSCPGIGSLDPTRHASYNSVKTLATCAIERLSFSRTDNTLRRDDIA
jgi:hypothetical protein